MILMLLLAHWKDGNFSEVKLGDIQVKYNTA